MSLVAPLARREWWRARLPRRTIVAWVRQFSLVSTLVTLWPYLRRERRRVALTALATVGLTTVEIANPLLIGVFVDSLLGQLKGSTRLPVASAGRPWLVGLLLGAAALRGLLQYQQRALAGRIGQAVASRLRRAIWTHLQQLPLAFTERRGPGRLLLRFTGDARAVQRLMGQGIIRLAQDVLVAAGVLTTLLLLNWRMGLALLALVPLHGALFWYLNPRLQRESRATRLRRIRLSAYLHDRLNGLALVKAFGQHRAETENFRTLNRDLARRGTRLQVRGGQLIGASAATVASCGAIALAIAAHEVSSGRLTGGTLVAFLTLSGLVTPIFGRVAQTNRTLQEAQISVDRLRDLLAEEPETGGTAGQPVLTVSNGRVVVEDLAFQYANEPPILKRIDLSARRGEIVAIVGPPGAGKSTLLDLLLRFRSPAAGRVSIDGHDVAAVDLRSLRSQVGLVPQRVPLFNGTLAENVIYGAPRERIARPGESDDGLASEASLLQRTERLGHLAPLLASLPAGWQTELDEGRRPLSRGQLRLLGLARVVAADPPIIVIDEVETLADAVNDDGATTASLGATLRELARSKTILVTANRLPAAFPVDRVYRLDGGYVTSAVPTAGEAVGRLSTTWRPARAARGPRVVDEQAAT